MPEPSLPRAFGFDSLAYNVSGIVGPALAGLVSGAASPAVATLALAGCAAGGAVVLASLPLERRARAVVPRDPRLRDGALVLRAIACWAS